MPIRVGRIASVHTEISHALRLTAAGEDMKILNASEGGNPNRFDVIQGFIRYAKGPLTVIGGKFVTLAGAKCSQAMIAADAIF